jgi:hypothetical protein
MRRSGDPGCDAGHNANCSSRVNLRSMSSAQRTLVAIGKKDGGWSPAGDAHVPRQRRPLVAAIDDEIVALRLACDRLVDRGE